MARNKVWHHTAPTPTTNRESSSRTEISQPPPPSSSSENFVDAAASTTTTEAFYTPRPRFHDLGVKSPLDSFGPLQSSTIKRLVEEVAVMLLLLTTTACLISSSSREILPKKLVRYFQYFQKLVKSSSYIFFPFKYTCP